jgi:hypothetical protein
MLGDGRDQCADNVDSVGYQRRCSGLGLVQQCRDNRRRTRSASDPSDGACRGEVVLCARRWTVRMQNAFGSFAGNPFGGQALCPDDCLGVVNAD